MRKKAGLNQKDVAEAIGTERSTVAKWESGVSVPRADKLPKLASLYKTTVDELMTELMENKK